MEHRQDQLVAVGVDGSRASTAALDVAVREARMRRHRLLVVHAAPVPLRRDTVLEAARVRAEHLAPDLPITARSLSGTPSAVLAGEVGDSDCLVVGARGLGGIGSVLFGSTSHALLRQAPCPVVVVRRPAPQHQGRVVVGVAGSTSYYAVELAFDEASRRGAELFAVHSWDGPGPLREAGSGWSSQARTRQAARAEQVLGAVLEPWEAKYPGVSVRRVVSKQPAAATLTWWSATADLVVVGRGAPGSRLPIGLTVLPLLRDSSCPVAVVPAR